MSKRILIALTVMLFSGLAFTSCKKEKQNVIPTASEYLTGKWEMSWMAYDENTNKKIDELEKESFPGNQISLFFNADGTGYFAYTSIYPGENEQENFTWSLSSDDKELTIKTQDNGIGIETMEYTISELNLDNCVLEFSEDYGFGVDITAWVGLVKQRQ